MNNSKLQEKQFKQVAKDAVARMKHGFWEDMLRKKESGELENQTKEMSSQDKLEIQKTVISKTQKSDDTEFEKRVYSLLDDDELSPIGKLIDKDKYQEMTMEERGRYVLNISNRFLKVKEKYEAEKILKSKFSAVMQTLHV
ncbi:MAG: hypothetical protein R3Y18_02620 [Bacillota bacterium]